MGYGFTLIEMMVTITLLCLLLAFAAPSMMSWIRNSKIRTTAEGLQSGLRQAQAEALRRSRQVSFSLTDNKPTSDDPIEAKEDGTNWVIHVLPPVDGSGSSVLAESGVIAEIGAGVQTTGPATVCFNSLGRLVSNDKEAIKAITGGATCVVDADDPTQAVRYTISSPNADRPLRVVVAVGGQVRMCDPSKTFSSTHPDGCT